MEGLATRAELRELGMPVESMAHHGSAMDLPQDVLLWSRSDVAALASLAASRAGDASWQGESFARMAQGWASAAALLPKAEKALARRGGAVGPGGVLRLAKALEAGGAARWMPFVVAWGAHQGVGPAQRADFAPMIERIVIDKDNAGLVAANIDYGSFNARIARIAMFAREAGRMDDVAALVIHARIEDLWTDPTRKEQLERSAFVDEHRQARAFFEAEALRVELCRGAAPKSAGPRGL